MTLDPTWLFLSLIPGGAGFVMLVYGRKQQRWPYMVAGAALVAYPYFTPTSSSLAIVGLLIGAALWAALRLGW